MKGMKRPERSDGKEGMNVLWGKNIAGRVNGHCSDFGLSMLGKGGRREIRERAEAVSCRGCGPPEGLQILL